MAQRLLGEEAPPAYLIENVDASDHRDARVREAYQEVLGTLGAPVVLEAATLGAHARRRRAWWTNLLPWPLFSALAADRRIPPEQRVAYILDEGRTATKG
jgi:hypothetical protein